MNRLTYSIVIPNWNGKLLLEKNLPILLKCIPKDVEIIVSDDCSTDGSVEFIKTRFPSIRIVLNPIHQGFSTVVNNGVSKSSADIIILLNTDVVPIKGFVDYLLPYFNDSSVFAVGCLDLSEERDLIVERGRGMMFWQDGFAMHKRLNIDGHSTGWVSCGSGAFRKSIWDKIGGLDEIYNPFYWEDIDLSYRALKAGYKIFFEPRSKVIHRHEEGKIKREYSKKQISRIAYRNQFIFIWKNITSNTLITYHIMSMPRRMLKSIFHKDLEFILGFIDALIYLPRIIESRRYSGSIVKLRDEVLLNTSIRSI